MPIRRALPVFVAFLVVFSFASLATGSDVLRRSSFTLGNDECDDVSPEVASQADGTFLAVWQRCYFPSTLMAQRIDALGRKLGAPIDLGEGVLPQVAAVPNRGFALAYLREEPSTGVFSVLVRRLAPTGAPLSDAVRVDEGGPERRVAYVVPRLSAAPDGRLFVVWRNLFLSPIPVPISELPVFGRMLDADGQPAGPTLEMGSAGIYDDADVSFDSEGRAIAVLSLGNVSARRFDATGAQIGNPIDVSGGDITALNPRLAPRPGGGWWLTWEEQQGSPQSDTSRTFLRALGADGAPAGPRIEVGLVGGFSEPVVGVDPDAFVLVAGHDANQGISMRRFDPSGAPASDLARLAGPDPRPLGRVALAPSAPTGFVALWEGAVDFYPPPPGQVAQAGWDLRGALLSAACPHASAVCAQVGTGLAEVEVRWKLGALAGTGRGLRLGNHLLFSLENPGRFDVAVDLHGGAIDWAATTNAEVEIRWTEGGTTLVATKPRGAFRSGRLALPAPPPSATISSAERLEALEPNVEAPPPTGACTPSATAGCLLDGRFRVSAFAAGADGVEHAAAVLGYADRQAIFELPGSAGGVSLSLIDGRSRNGKFWLYLGGLSDRAYRVEVADMTTGTLKTYSNTAGQRQSRADRQAF